MKSGSLVSTLSDAGWACVVTNENICQLNQSYEESSILEEKKSLITRDFWADRFYLFFLQKILLNQIKSLTTLADFQHIQLESNLQVLAHELPISRPNRNLIINNKLKSFV